MIFCLSSEDIYLPQRIFCSCSFVTVSELFYGAMFENLAILSAILLHIKSPVASAVFSVILFELVLRAFVADCLAWLNFYFL